MTTKDSHPGPGRAVAAALLSLLVLTAACSSDGADLGSSASTSAAPITSITAPEGSSATTTAAAGVAAADASWSGTTSGAYAAGYSDQDLDAAGAVTPTATITLAGASATVEGSGVTVAGSLVTITGAGTYLLGGTLDEGQVVVDAGASSDVRLILDGVDITCSTSAPLYVRNADKVVVTLADGSDNSLADGDSYVYPDDSAGEPDATLFSNDDLTINGTGSLTVEGNFHDGIRSDDDLKVVSGTITLTAVNDGLKGRDAVVVKDGVITITAGGDGIQASNTEDAALGYVVIEGGSFVIDAGGDGIQAETGLVVSGGDLTVTAGGGSAQGSVFDEDDSISTKGLKGVAELTITGGSFIIDSADDTLHSNGNLTVTNGEFLLATGDDGLHSDADLRIDGGEITITISYEGIEGASVTINAGDIHLASQDDGINTVGGGDGSTTEARQPGQGPGGPGGFEGSGDYPLYVNGGYVVIDAVGDGIDINGPIEMTGGTVIINGPINNANGPIDYTGSFTIGGGLLVAVGSSGMAQAPDASSTQPSAGLAWRSPVEGGTIIHIETQDGEDLLTFAPTKQFQSLVLSSAQLEVGATCVVYVGGTSNGTAVDGLYTGGAYTPGTEAGTFTVES